METTMEMGKGEVLPKDAPMLRYYPKSARPSILEEPTGEPLFTAGKVWGPLLKRGENLYAVCELSDAGGWAIVEPIKLTDETEANYKSDITCPACGHVNQDSWEHRADSEDDFECGFCGAILEWEREVEVTYNAKLKRLPTIVEVPV